MSTPSTDVSIKVHIPTPLRSYTNNQSTVAVPGSNVGEVVANLIDDYDALRDHLHDRTGRLRSFINLYLNDEDIRYLDGEQTPIKSGDTLSIVPSIAGGTGFAVGRSPSTV